MAFVSCRACNWNQDDFWDPNLLNPDAYTPFRQDIVGYLKDNLFRDRCYFDISFFGENEEKLKPDGQDEKGMWVRGTTLVAWDLRRRARIIESMHWRTEQEWLKDPKPFVCPKCGNWLSID